MIYHTFHQGRTHRRAVGKFYYGHATEDIIFDKGIRFFGYTFFVRRNYRAIPKDRNI